MNTHLSRREWLTLMPGTAAAVTLSPSSVAASDAPADPFTYCLNTSTLRGQKLPLTQEIDIVAQAGYGAIEPWISELDQHVKSGGSLKDVAKQLRDHGLTVPSAIGFAEWIVDDPARRKRGLEEAKRSMDLLKQIGGTRIAAPPVGATQQDGMDLLKVAERYRALLELGDEMGIVPEIEVWGFSKTLSRLGECLFVAAECGHPKACILGDVYHLYKGGSGLSGLRLISGAAMPVFHMNDYPAKPARAEITDAARVYPGDGVAPLKQMFHDLRSSGFRGVLSLELFNRDYWKQDALTVARTGLAKMRASVADGA